LVVVRIAISRAAKRAKGHDDDDDDAGGPASRWTAVKSAV
jgi:hypothetical protein